MAETLTFYTNPASRGRIVRWMLEEVGQAYDTELLDYTTTMKAPEYLAINPMGKVPAIRHGGTVVTEGAAICAYLADAFPQAGLAPPIGDPTRGSYLRWMFFAAGPMEAAVTNRMFGLEVPAGRERASGYGSYAAAMEMLEHAVLAGDYLVGERFSVADLYVGSQIGFGMMFGGVERRPAFERYVARVSDRPAKRRADEIDNGLMANATT